MEKPKFQYIPFKRFIVELEVDGKTLFSERLQTKKAALNLLDRYQYLKGIKGAIIDTKAGNMKGDKP